MSQIPLAAFDPLFWAHHTMIDRLWALWQQAHPGAGAPLAVQDPHLEVLAPVRQWHLKNTEDKLSYARRRRLPCPDKHAGDNPELRARRAAAANAEPAEPERSIDRSRNYAALTAPKGRSRSS